MVKKKVLYTWTGLLFKKCVEGQDIKTYKTSVVPLDNSKLYLSMLNDSVTPNEKEKLQVMMKKNLRIKYHQVIIKISKG